MKHIIIDMEGQNEPIKFSLLVFGNYFLQIDCGRYVAQQSPLQEDK
jgi:hypothetical protein